MAYTVVAAANGNTNLGNGRKIEDVLVADPGEEVQHVRHVLHSVGDQLVQATQSLMWERT